ncbi:MAG: aminotransferase class V-fold PLP-dependent enzyme, partial [bacterium]
MSERTKLVAVGYASNATGTINPVGEIIRLAQSAGALTWVDAVHYAPHGRLAFDSLGCDFLVCSGYKFFGPHVGVLCARRTLLQEISPYKLRPCTESLPGRWMTGTQNHECIAGVLAAVDYLAALGGLGPRRSSLVAALAAVR